MIELKTTRSRKNFWLRPLRRKAGQYSCLCILTAALLMSGTLCSQDRDKTDQPEKVMDVLGVKPGMVIGEVGAGHGYFTFKLARRVGESGKIYANDISESALDALKKHRDDEGLANVEVIRGKVEDPLLPKAELDMVFMVNAFHDLDKPVELLDNLLPSLKPGGLVVIIDHDPERDPQARGHFLTREKVLEKVRQSKFEVDRVETFLAYQNIYVLRLKNGKA